MITFTVNSTLGNALRVLKNKLGTLPEEAYNEFKSITPIKTGNARRKTSLSNKQKIKAAYPYAGRLDKGYSKQAPNGMSKPTIDFIRRRVKQIVKGK